MIDENEILNLIEHSALDSFLEKQNIPHNIRDLVNRELRIYHNQAYSFREQEILMEHIKLLLQFPWKKEYIQNFNLTKMIKSFDKSIYGLEEVKNTVKDYFITRFLCGRNDLSILCFVGPSGTGKSTVAYEIAECLKYSICNIDLSSLSNQKDLIGDSKYEVNAKPGEFVDGIIKAGVKNPVILLENIDKMQSFDKFEIVKILSKILDHKTKYQLVDNYLSVPICLDDAILIATANHNEDIPKELLPYMQLIEFHSYLNQDKLEIAKQFILPKLCKLNNLTRKQFRITDDAIIYMIEYYVNDSGMKNLEIQLDRILKRVKKGMIQKEYHSFTVDVDQVNKILGTGEPHIPSDFYANKVGVIHGLTSVNGIGKLTSIEANILNGKEKIMITGNKNLNIYDSAQIALSYIRTLPEMKSFNDEYFDHHCIHLNMLDALMIEDGNSITVALALVIYSALIGRPINGKLALIGGLDLKGNIYPANHLEEKLIIAKNSGIKKIIVSSNSRSEINNYSNQLLEDLEVIYVSEMKEAIKAGIVKQTILLKEEG